MARPLRLLADQALSRAAGAPLVDGNRVRLLRDAQENYPPWLDAIRSAERWIHFEPYIIRNDESGRDFAEALTARAKAGVPVRLVYDWMGAQTATPWPFWERLRGAGVTIRAFNQPRLDSPFGWLIRDHRKMLAVDGHVAFVSGLCVADAWAGGERAKGADPWRDTGVEICGPAVAEVEQSFAEIWATMGAPLPPEEIPEPTAGAACGPVALRVIATRPATTGVFRLDQLVAALARERLWITDAYFVGTSAYMQALIVAAADGVDVRMLMPGGGSDLPWIQQLTRAGYRPLLEAGVRIFEWNGTMLHAKTAVADGRWARVGSSNLNVQSWLGNWELDVAIEDEDFGRRMEQMFLRDLENATEIVVSDHRLRTAEPSAGSTAAASPSHRRRWVRRATRARRAATAGALRMSRTFGAALTARQPLGYTEAISLLWGVFLIGALGVVGVLWPSALAYPAAVFCLWLAVSWAVQAFNLWWEHRRTLSRSQPDAANRQDAA